MKNHLSFRNKTGSCFNSKLILLLISVLVLIENNALCQDKPENGEKKSISISVSSKISDGIKFLKVAVTRKENRKSISVDDAKSPVALYLNQVKATNTSTGTGLIGKLNLDDNGEALFELPESFNTLTSRLHQFRFIARMEGDSLYEDAEGEVSISDAKISVEYSGKDSIKSATATLTAWNDSSKTYLPVAGAELRLFIKRTFSLFPFGEEGLTTDKNGQVSGDLPLDLPGEVGGSIIIVGSVIEHENYGTIESAQSVEWAVLPRNNEAMGRTLWSTGHNAPLPLVIISFSIIAGIWGTLIYLVFQLFKIRKIGKQEAK